MKKKTPKKQPTAKSIAPAVESVRVVRRPLAYLRRAKPKEQGWRADLIDELLAMLSASRYEGDLWKWSVNEEEGCFDWHEPGAMLLITVDRRALAERTLHGVERFCRNVIERWDSVEDDDKKRVITRSARRAFREYMDRVVQWIMHADHMLREAALSIAHTANDDLLILHRRALTGQPGASNFWLKKKTLQDWITRENAAFLTAELAPLKPAFKKTGDADEDLALWRFVTRTREELKGITFRDREVCRLACERFKIPTYPQYKRKKARGKRLASNLG